MLSHKYKFISTHVVKTGASTMQEVLGKYCDPTVSKHETIYEIICRKNITDWENYFKFSFVRNPWDKVVSQYHFNAHQHYAEPVDFEKYVIDYYNGKPITTAKTAVHWPWFMGANNTWLPDFIGRFDFFQEDFDKICEIVGLEQETLPIVNATKHEHYTTYYNDQTRKMIGEIFAKDIEIFGFTFEGGTPEWTGPSL